MPCRPIGRHSPPHHMRAIWAPDGLGKGLCCPRQYTVEVSCAALNGLYPLGRGPQVADVVHQAFHSAVQGSIDFLLKMRQLAFRKW